MDKALILCYPKTGSNNWRMISRLPALPIGLVVEADKQKDQYAIMKMRISDQNFKGEIQE